jgi:2-polyprenyl-6-methoxyphenol hydroxylase-like FAD-dependent oxidoreductase
VDIRTAGVSVMRRMAGMEAQVRAHPALEEGISLVREDGRPYGTIGATGNADQQGLVSEFEIFRGDLSKVLVDLTKELGNVEYIFGEQIASIQQSEDKNGAVAVEFANGARVQEFDLVVACDGATSRTRAMAFQCGVRDHIIPSNIFAAYFSTSRDLLHGSKIGHGFSAPGGRFVSVGADPAGGSRGMLMAHSAASTEAFRLAAKDGEDATKLFVAKLYNRAGWIIDDILREMMDSKDFYASEIVQVKAPSLHQNRVVLVGDAGYSAGPTGGGTSLALAGGYVLAGEILAHSGDLEAGLRGYEDRMRPLITEFQKIPPFVSVVMAPQTRWGIWVRNHIFALIAWSGVADFVQKYLGAAFADNKEYKLPEYEWLR